MSKKIIEIKDKSEFNFRVFLFGIAVVFSATVFYFEGKTKTFSAELKLPHVGDTYELFEEVKVDGHRHYTSRVKYTVTHVDDEMIHVNGIDDNGEAAWARRTHNPLIGAIEFSSPGIDTGRIDYYGKIKDIFPLTPGKSAVYKKIGNTQLSGYFVTELECEVQNMDHVVVPAGQFNAVKVYCFKPNGNDKSFKSRMWYDPNSGVIVKRESKFMMNIDGQPKRYLTKSELLKFNQVPREETTPRQIASSKAQEQPYKVNEGDVETK